MFNTVYSDFVELVIVNPCRNSTVNMDGALQVLDMKVPLDDEYVTEEYDGPTDSISSIYGNGYDKCGPRSYSLLESDGQTFSLDLFKPVFKDDQNGDPDFISLNLTSFIDGKLTNSNFTLLV